KTFEMAIAKLPKEATLYYEKGLCLGRAKQFDNSLAALQQASRTDPSNPQYSRAAGFMLARMGRDEEAFPWLAKSMSDADARYNLVRMMEHPGNEPASARQLALALQLRPNHPAALKMAEERNNPGSQEPEQPSQPAQPVQTAKLTSASPYNVVQPAVDRSDVSTQSPGPQSVAAPLRLDK